MKILQLCHKMPFPLHDGGAFSIYHTAMGLISERFEVKVFSINTPKSWVDEVAIPEDFKAATKFGFARVDTRFKPFDALANLFSSHSYLAQRFYSKKFEDELIRILKEEQFDIVQLEHLYLCLYLNTIRNNSKAKVVFRPQNVENQVWSRLIDHKINPVKKYYLKIMADRLKRFEVTMANRVDGIIAISPDDALTFLSYAPGKPVTFVPIGFDISRHNGYDDQKQYQSFPVFYHLGSMDWLPNVQGIAWFVEEVMPCVIDRYPDFVFRIAGKKMPPFFEKMNRKNLIVDGEVPDSMKYQEDKAILIVPLHAGSGLRVKIIEAMALGKTVISTSVGAAGIPYLNGENLLIADNKEEFADQILTCAASLEFCRKIGKNAQKLAFENYDRKRTANEMAGFYKKLTGMN